MQAGLFSLHNSRVLSARIAMPADSLFDTYRNASTEFDSIASAGFAANNGDQGRQISFPDGVVKIPHARKSPFTFASELST